MSFTYIGTELEIFHHATNWKSYYGKHLQPYLGREVLEVGAGIGGTTKSLISNRQTKWLCLEPDEQFASEIRKLISKGDLPLSCEVRQQSLSEINENEKFDSIIYIDVLEHIEDDKFETATAAKHLKTGGYLTVLAPAHQFLYTPFDKAIGHFRRYNIKGLKNAVPGELRLVKLIYLDSIGILASLGNKLILKKSAPTYEQIQFWDKKLVPISKITDPILRFKLGKSVLGVWQKQ